MQGRRKDINLIGQTFSELTVIGEGERIKNKPTWKCICSCGSICYATTYELKSNVRKSCGHLRGKSRLLDLSGKQFNDLTVLYQVENKKFTDYYKTGRTYWRCRCSCGKECDVQTSDITRGKRKDCGHSHDEYLHTKRTIDISGNIYGQLKVIEMLPAQKVDKKWRAMCKAECLLCGNIIEIKRDYLINGDTKSCGCCRSQGELEVQNYLIEHNRKFKKQYKFDDLKTPKNAYCYFDFAVIKEDETLDFLIEYQGIQHYIENCNYESFGKYEREVTDDLKRNYCKENNITLYEIKYSENVNEALDEIFASQSCA